MSRVAVDLKTMGRTAVCLVAVALMGLLASCKPGVPGKFIQPGDMEDLLVDYHLSQAMAQSMDTLSYEQREYQQVLYFEAVLKKHGVTRAEFDSSLVYYYTRADRFRDIYKRVGERLSDEARELGVSESEVSKMARASASGDTVNVWNGPVNTVLMPYAPYNRLDFTIKADTSYRKGDSFLLHFTPNYLYQSGSKVATAYMAIKYDNDSISTQRVSVNSYGLTQLRMAPNDTCRAKEIRGFIYLAPGSERSSTLKLLFLTDLQLVKLRKLKPKDGEDAVKPQADAVPLRQQDADVAGPSPRPVPIGARGPRGKLPPPPPVVEPQK